MAETREGERSVLDGEDELLQTMIKELHAARDMELSTQGSATDPGVPSFLMERGGRPVDPKLIAIGPNHHDNEKLALMEQLKRKALVDLLARRPDNLLDKYVEAIRSLEERIRAFYHPNHSHIDSDALVKMMVLDGCLILELIIKFYSATQWKFEGLNVRDSKDAIWHDLLLPENQIPFFVLQALFDVCLGDDASDIPLTEIAISYHADRGSSCVPNAPVHHLLHLIHGSFIPISSSSIRTPSRSRKARHTLFSSIIWLLSLLLYNPRPPAAGRKHSKWRPNARRVRSATELQLRGVKLLAAPPRKLSLIDIRFSKDDGVMTIPPLVIGPSTFALFRNLMSFEMSYPGGSRLDLVTYMVFLGGLVRTPADVALLEERDIVVTQLEKREDVVDFFKGVGAGGYLPREDNYLWPVLRDVNEYCKDDRNRWRASLIRDYFSSPWTMMYVYAGLLALVLTFLQSFFAVFTYFRPPP